MDIEKAMKLTRASDLLRACHEAEARNCEQWVIRELYRLYYEAVKREETA